MSYLYPPVVYLENDNFDSNYRLIPIVNPWNEKAMFDKVTIVMIQGDFCGFCTRMKPIFQEVANNLYTHMDFATIQIDQKDQTGLIQREALQNILKYEIPGVPVIVKIRKGETQDRIETYQGSHNVKELYEWCVRQS